jgi:D-glycero-alpha-D-manno-heptose 1-phosphate guanylyltransferase
LFMLAGGFGTRLSQVVKDVPKPLAPIHGRPFLAYLLENYHRQGIRKFEPAYLRIVW